MADVGVTLRESRPSWLSTAYAQRNHRSTVECCIVSLAMVNLFRRTSCNGWAWHAKLRRSTRAVLLRV
jgi:hypothetical protein